MKCPKCGYLGFETSERCRNCGYDFSLSVQVEPTELPLHVSDHAGQPLADFDLGELDTGRVEEGSAGLDLDRVIGDDPDERDARPRPGLPSTTLKPGKPRPAVRADTDASSVAIAPGAPGAPRPVAPRVPVLPLFARDDEVAAPRPARPPLSVRRTTPEIPRGRAVSAAPARVDSPRLSLEPETGAPRDGEGPRAPAPPTALEAASAAARFGAMAIDLALLTAINAGVVYLTLAMTGLAAEDADVLPIMPLMGFFVILSGGYLVTFIAASGQTIGKMVTGIRVIGDDARRVDVAGAVLRAAGCGVSLLTVGLGYLPAFVTADRRALQDRIAGTRVVSAR